MHIWGLIYKTSQDEPTNMLRRNRTYEKFTKELRKNYDVYNYLCVN